MKIQKLEKSQAFRLMLADTLPVKSSSGEEIHARRAFNDKNLIIMSKEALEAYKQFKAAPKFMTPSQVNLLNLALDQAGVVDHRMLKRI